MPSVYYAISHSIFSGIFCVECSFFKVCVIIMYDFETSWTSVKPKVHSVN